MDTDKTPITKQQFRTSHQTPYYPKYHIIPRLPPANNGKLLTKELPRSLEAHKQPQTTESNIATQSIILTKDEFPKDLLDIAQNKLGINNLDEVPSISELGELLGTDSALETIKYIREITATEEGIALVKAYIESSDYTDSTGVNTIPTTTEYSTSANIESASELNLATPSFFERLSAYFNIFDFFLRNKETDLEKNLQQFDSGTTQKSVQKKPLFMRHPLPYHYPIPLRPVIIYKPRNVAPARHNGFRSVGHLNTPKYRKQPLKAVAKSGLKSPKTENQKQQERILFGENVSKFSPPQDRSALIDTQYVAAAIEKAIEQDEDLKKIINSTDTLK